MAENNIIIKITSETDLTAAQQQLGELTERAKEQERALKNLTKVEQEDAQSIRNLGIHGERLSKRLKENAKYYNELRSQKRADIAATKQSITELNKQVKAYKTLNGQSGRMVQQLRAMREELQRMEEGGEFGTKAFMELSIAAGQLEDQIGDTQQRIRILSSDTKEIDAIMGLGEGLAGAFYIATSGAELFGGELEGLQTAFYKVQAAMSILSGTQQMFNALQKDSAVAVVFGTSLEKTKQKFLQKSIAYERLYNIQKATGSATNVAQATTTSLVTKAQWKLNAAMAANPIGVIITLAIAAVAVLAGLGVAIYKVVHYFSDAGKAEREYADASRELEKVQAENAAGAAKRAYDRQQQIKATNDAEEKALADAEKRNASELELAQLKSNYAKQRAEEAQKYSDEEVKRNQNEVAQLEKMVAAKQKEVNAHRNGSKKQKKAQEELNEVTQQYYDALQKGKDIEQEATEAKKEAKKAEEELIKTREQLRQQAQQANIDLMREGAAKEIKQIELNYKEQLKTIQGNSQEEITLRKLLEKKKAKEIAAVRAKYAQQAQQTAIQEQKNLLTIMSQSNGTEADYADQIALTKKIAEAEAQARIDALDKESMSDKEYAAQVESIRLDLANTIRSIDQQEADRQAANAKRLTEIEVQEAEARKDALTGAEDIDTRKAITADYYASLRKQIEENAEFERQAVEQSTDTAEVKAAKLKQIDSKMNADIQENTKQTAEDIASIYDEAIQKIKDRAESGMSKAVFGDGTSLSALQETLDAQLKIYDEMRAEIEDQYRMEIIQKEDYEKQLTEITKKETDARTTYQTEAMKTISSGFSAVAEHVQQMSDLIFGAIVDNIQAQIDALDEMYTTDADEAKKSNEKKYISEKELEEKKAKLTLRQQKLNKANAILQISLDTAMAIMSIWAQVPKVDFGASAIALTAMTSVLGATQLAIAASKPLSQYAKGRKGGEGEYALVGEKGAEIMYVPKGASIIPHNKIDNPAAWGDYGVPQLPIPATADISPEILNQAVAATTWQPIDYDRLGAAVAKAMPKQRTVNVNVDRSGVMVQNGSNRRTYLNTKYYAQW